ncbi:MAG: hypothetical protein UX72_C0039G0029 [Parcubacteria group bacterium GW2011_GWA2_47_10]|nr:MAG: hypothetical protein UX72_C0039G0029 [Parcubacteria group bacterium GW2011_GWA2_47_10]
MLYPVLRFITLLITLGANLLSHERLPVWHVFRAWHEAWLGERWDVLQELHASSHVFTRFLWGSRKRTQSMFQRIVLGR